MSNPLAIAAVTATLRNLIMEVTADLPDAQVTAKPPHKARNSNDNGNQLNLFLYQTALNAAWQQKKGSNRVNVDEMGKPPLALNLYYLLTAYGKNDEDILSHRLLGQAMSILHDRGAFSADEIKAALPGNDLYEQVEQVRITPQPLSLEELSKLWNNFQTSYGISVAYQVSVVLISSQRRAATTLTVGQRQPSDRSSLSQSSPIPSYPTLTELQLPNQQVSVQPSDILNLRGHHLDGDRVVIRFRSVGLKEVRTMSPRLEGNGTSLKVQLPATPTPATGWLIGWYAVAVIVSRAGKPELTTNELPFSLAPRILAIAPKRARQDSNGHVTLTLTCSLPVLPEQQAVLLLGEWEIPAQSHPVTTDTLTFVIPAIPPGEYPAYLRVDGIDSLPTPYPIALLPSSESQEVSIR